MPAPPTIWDVIIVGQGLAGTTLAWNLIEAGQRVLVLDAEEPVTSSKIAAGLITPITGQRLALSWRIADVLPSAHKFYASVEARTGAKFFYPRTAVRLFQSDAERQIWAERSSRPAFQAHTISPQPEVLLAPDVATTRDGGFHMSTAQLDVAAYLAASRANFPYERMTIDWHRDVAFAGNAITVGPYTARRVISCEGYAAARNPYFSAVPWKPAKGEILTIRLAKPLAPLCLHRGVWLAPTADPCVFKTGSTYDWKVQDQTPTASARSEIETKLRQFFRVPYRVIGHEAAVRPVIRESKAMIGLHPIHEALGFFNGLGSKGALHAPWFAALFTDVLVHGRPLPPEFDIPNQRLTSNGAPLPVT